MNYSFENIAGYIEEKEELKRLCEIFNNREKYKEKGAKLPKGIIFYGESGTGKTLFAKVMASVCDLEVLKINVADAEKESDICKLIKKTFAKAARKKTPTMIFFDELDKVLPNDSERYYSDRSKTVLAQLLTLIDGMDSSGDLVFVATCNYYGSIPETLVRPGRIDKKINVGLPNYSSRVEILNMYAKKSSCQFEMSVQDMAKLCSGFSCAALETLINECILHSDEKGFVNEQLIRSQFFEIKNEDIPRESSSVEDSITACHNVGSFIVAKAYNSGHYTLSLEKDTVCNNFFNAIVTLNDNRDDWDDDDDDDWDDDDFDECDEDCGDETDENVTSILSKSDYINTITVLLGGYVAEEVVFNKVYDNVIEPLNSIDRILQRMSDCAMFGVGLRYSEERNRDVLTYTDEHVAKVNAVFEQTVNDCYEKAKAIIEKNGELISKLSKVLVEKQIVQETDCEKLIEEFGGIKF
ncbi:MAG: AAA family ATPase [Clostridia bacterium]|nr:AAA family ATPase [Clostridia bacterium]